MTLSLCMIVKNEELVLARVLDSVKGLFDEIIIVDTGSTDSTKNIAYKYTSQVYDMPWQDDFSRARNFSQLQATSDYIMWLDADDVVSKENLEKLLELKQQLDGTVDCYMLKYAISFDVNNKPTFVFNRERIVKNDGTFVWKDPVHETMTPHGNIAYKDIAIYHKKLKHTPSDRNLKIYKKMLLKNIKLTPRQKFYYSRELYYNGLYKEAEVSLYDYLENYSGWLENKIDACIILSSTLVQLNKTTQAISVLIQSFVFDTPRAEVLFELNKLYISTKQYDKAIYWAKLATKLNINTKSGAFINPKSYDIYPYLQLVVAYYNKNNMALAKKYNDKVLQLEPNNKSALHNDKLFK